MPWTTNQNGVLLWTGGGDWSNNGATSQPSIQYGSQDPTYYNTVVNPTSSSNGQFSSDMSDDQVSSLIGSYVNQGSGPTDPNYWMGKWNEFGKSDPAYFLDRLKQGINQNSGRQVFGDASYTPAGNNADYSFMGSSGNSNSSLLPSTAPSWLTDFQNTIKGFTDVLNKPRSAEYTPSAQSKPQYGMGNYNMASLNPSGTGTNYTSGLKSLGFGF